MFKDSLFKPKFFLGWIPSAYLLGMLGGSSMAMGKDIWFVVFILCMNALIALVLTTLFYKFKGKAPVNWEIVWWCFPAVFFVNIFWQLVKMAFR
ncbi:hypothetical protein AB3R30_23010 [Leptolyngbyaceae cyanobacterium UHCC 1019]